MIEPGSYLRYTRFQSANLSAPMWARVSPSGNQAALILDMSGRSEADRRWDIVDPATNPDGVNRTVYPPGDEPEQLLLDRAKYALTKGEV